LFVIFVLVKSSVFSETSQIFENLGYVQKLDPLLDLSCRSAAQTSTQPKSNENASFINETILYLKGISKSLGLCRCLRCDRTNLLSFAFMYIR